MFYGLMFSRGHCHHRQVSTSASSGGSAYFLRLIHRFLVELDSISCLWLASCWRCEDIVWFHALDVFARCLLDTSTFKIYFFIRTSSENTVKTHRLLTLSKEDELWCTSRACFHVWSVTEAVHRALSFELSQPLMVQVWQKEAVVSLLLLHPLPPPLWNQPAVPGSCHGVFAEIGCYGIILVLHAGETQDRTSTEFFLFFFFSELRWCRIKRVDRLICFTFCFTFLSGAPTVCPSC